MANYCEKCGNKLELKFLELEGMIPFCNKCNDYRFPYFNTAVSMIIVNPDETKMLYVKQYGTGKGRDIHINETEQKAQTRTHLNTVNWCL